MKNSKDRLVGYAAAQVRCARDDLNVAANTSRTPASRLSFLADVVGGLTAALRYLDEHDAEERKAKR